jgi:hypothetical protein
MRKSCWIIVATGLLAAVSVALAQRQGRQGEDSRSTGADDTVNRMMEMDKDKDGKLTKAEVTDERLHRLFDRADADKDGFVTRDELTALVAKEQANTRFGRGGPGGGPPGGGPPGGGPGGFMMGPPRPGEILPPPLRQRLRLSAAQTNQLDALQKEVDSRLEEILSAEQKTILKEMRRRGPREFGFPGRSGPRPGRGGPPPPDGPPPGEEPPPP